MYNVHVIHQVLYIGTLVYTEQWQKKSAFEWYVASFYNEWDLLGMNQTAAGV